MILEKYFPAVMKSYRVKHPSLRQLGTFGRSQNLTGYTAYMIFDQLPVKMPVLYRHTGRYAPDRATSCNIGKLD